MEEKIQPTFQKKIKINMAISYKLQNNFFLIKTNVFFFNQEVL